MSKKWIALILVYLVQFALTSCFCGDCEEVHTFKIMYNGLDLEAWDTSGFQDKEVSTEVNKNSFGLIIRMKHEEKEVTHLESKQKKQSYGSLSLHACTCYNAEFITVDPISSIEIAVMDTKTKEVRDVTTNFYVTRYDKEPVVLSEFFPVESEKRYYDFKLDMLKYEDVPKSAIFKVKVILKSGKELTRETQEVNFR